MQVATERLRNNKEKYMHLDRNRKNRLIIISLLFASALSAHAAIIGASNTGVDNNGVLLPGLSTDPHFVLTGPIAPAVVVNPAPGVYPANNGTWLPDSASPVSQWIGPLGNFPSNGSCSGCGGIYDYVLTLDSTLPLTDVLSGRWTSDDESCIFLNGASQACISTNQYTSWHPFTITGFTNGNTNLLDFRVTNGGGPTGLRVEFTGTSATPEPATFALTGLGLLGIGLLKRKRPKRVTRN